ncbi:MAG TPA: PorV/PorQ family protein [Candidatus Goldiibacteriota bacterium]|nr:PorV/PorQ family protein [Candidatus Goldiibacteriota bacterium]
MIKKFLFTALTAVFVFVLTSTSRADQGTTSAVFLKLEQGARPIAMGGAYTAVADDVHSILWNPAGLSRLQGFEVSFMHTMWFADIFYDYLALAYPAGEIGTFGLSVVYVNSGDIKKWDIAGNPQGSFSSSDLGFGISYGTTISKDLSLGVTIKLFNSSIDDKGAFGFAGDLGAIYTTPVEGLKAGFAVQNLGPKFGFGEAFLLPINFRLGLSYSAVRNLILSLDYIQPIETNGILAAGMEYWYRDLLVLRLGYQYQGMLDKNYYYENYAGPSILAGFVIGAGIKIDIYSVDYAYRQYGVLESTHRIGLTVKFK